MLAAAFAMKLFNVFLFNFHQYVRYGAPIIAGKTDIKIERMWMKS